LPEETEDDPRREVLEVEVSDGEPGSVAQVGEVDQHPHLHQRYLGDRLRSQAASICFQHPPTSSRSLLALLGFCSTSLITRSRAMGEGNRPLGTMRWPALDQAPSSTR